MRKLVVAAAAVLCVFMAVPAAYAIDVEVGPGDCASTPEQECPFPEDPTAGEPNMLPDESGVYLSADADPGSGSGYAAVAVGEEDKPDSVTRLAVAFDQDGVTIYAEDYTEGDIVADAVENTDQALGCVLFSCDPETDSDSDAVKIRLDF